MWLIFLKLLYQKYVYGSSICLYSRCYKDMTGNCLVLYPNTTVNFQSEFQFTEQISFLFDQTADLKLRLPMPHFLSLSCPQTGNVTQQRQALEWWWWWWWRRRQRWRRQTSPLLAQWRRQ